VPNSDAPVALFNLGKYEQALESIDIVLQMQPESSISWVVKGNISRFLLNRQEALICYEKALLINPKSVEALTKLAFLYAFSKEEVSQNKALQYYEKVLSIEPNNFKACNNKIDILHRQGKHDEAIMTYDKAIEIEPNNPDIWFKRGLMLYQHYPEEAITSYDKALEINPNFSDALFEKGRILFTLKNYREAIINFNESLSLNNDAHTLYWIGKTLSDLQRYNEAIISFDKALSHENDYFVLHEKGLALANSRKYEEALKCFDDAINLEPKFFDAWYSRAYLEREEDNWETALENYNKALELDPSSAEAWFERAEIISWMDEKNRGDLISAYEDLITKCFPDDFYYPLAIYLKAGELDLLGKYEESLATYNHYLEIKPDDEHAWEEKGDVLEKLGRYEETKICQFKAKNILKEAEDKCVTLIRQLGRYDLLTNDGNRLVERLHSSLPNMNFPKDANKIKHDEIIYALLKIGKAVGLKVYIGKKEQYTSTWNGESFRELSLPELPIDKPLTQWQRDRIEQIDLIWFDSENNPVYAFEIETTTKITTGIDRFIELLKIFPDVAKKIVIIIPPKRLSIMNRLLKDSHYIGDPLCWENKLMYSTNDRIAQMYQKLSSESILDLQKILQQIPSFINSPNILISD